MNILVTGGCGFIGSNFIIHMLEKYDYEIYDAKARLSIYFTSPIGIGEHPQFTEEMDKLLEKIANAEDKKSVLERHFNDGNWLLPFFEDNK